MERLPNGIHTPEFRVRAVRKCHFNSLTRHNRPTSARLAAVPSQWGNANEHEAPNEYYISISDRNAAYL